MRTKRYEKIPKFLRHDFRIRGVEGERSRVASSLALTIERKHFSL